MIKHRMEELSVSDLMLRYNLIVPEIQREYVWGNHPDIIDKFIFDIKNAFQEDENNFIKSLNFFKERISHVTNDLEIENAHNKFNADRFLNIGFLYSYRPNYFFGDGYQEDAFLIDGQQRFTTLFLLLFYLSILGDRKEIFEELFKINNENNQLAFDYRVRNLTHDFIAELVKKRDDVTSIEQSTWFLSDFGADDTIKSMLKTLHKIAQEFPTPQNVNDKQILGKYFDFITNNIKFWHFKTEATSQGEELYITMNSRGEKLSNPEKLKASLFENTVDKFLWGKEWEIWQDFFWNNKASNHENADLCFTEFLQCIEGLYKFQSQNNIEVQYDLNFIKKYFASLFRLINDTSEQFYWLKKCKAEMLKILNLNFAKNEKKITDWFVPGDEYKGVDNCRMVFVWSILEYLCGIDRSIILSNKDLRVIRLFWMRYNNNDRSIKKLISKIDSLKTENGLFKIDDSFSDDEIAKIDYYSNKLGLKELDDIHKLEILIWKIEDHPLNLNGSELGFINITHLVDFERSITEEYLININEKFIELFPAPLFSPPNNLATLLLYYSTDDNVFWNKIYTKDYVRYQCNDWRRTIRKPVFKVFFDQFCNDKDIGIMISENQKLFFNNKTVDDIRSLESHRCQAIVYSILVDKIWDYGYIAFFRREINDTTQRIFNRELKIFKIEKDFRSGVKELWLEVQSKLGNITIDNFLQAMIDKLKN